MRFGEVDSATILTRSIGFVLDQFRKGVTAPTDASVGTTPTIPVLLFDATNELLTILARFPADMDLTADVTLLLGFSLVSSQSNDDTLSVTVDYVVPEINTTGAGGNRTSTQLTPTIDVTTGNGLAVNDVYLMPVTIPFNDATNPFSANSVGLGFEFHLTNLTQVASIHFFGGAMQYTALY